ncbi:uncharacterized protein [Gossypium hirsutum]|uniref:Reverse transcriptase n=1 Tax=Gossypium hirsutum TaxID=3635 RepID=A0A1U8PY60_GOSHI|nr:uncharacterized protein LOC107963150 [Gossypium hirsutum]
MGYLISPNQASFVMGPNIADNIAISQEAIHCLKKFKGKMFGMALKIYLEKAYERVWWDFLEDTLIEVGWKPLRLSRSRLALTHLFFADDLFLFGEADRGRFGMGLVEEMAPWFDPNLYCSDDSSVIIKCTRSVDLEVEVGEGTIFQVEARAMLKGLCLAWDKGF